MLRFTLVACLALTALSARSLPAQTQAEPTDFAKFPEILIAPTRVAWCSAFARDESWIATCYGAYSGEFGRLRVWDAKTGKVKWEARELRGIRRVAISPDSSLVASGNWGGVIHLRDAATGKIKKRIQNSGGSMAGVAFSSDGKRVASCGNSRNVEVWDVATGDLQLLLEGHPNVVHGVEFSPDDKLLASHGRDRTLRLWNADDGNSVRILRHPGEVFDAAFFPDGKQLATACADGQLRIYNLTEDNPVRTLWPTLSSPRPSPLSAVAISSDGALVAASDAENIRVWSTANWQTILTLRTRGYTAGLSFSKDSSTLSSSDADATVRLWELPAGRERLAFELPTEMQLGAGEIRGMAVAPTGTLVATVDGTNQVKLWDRTTGKLVRTLDSADALTAIAFAPQGRILVTVGARVCLWDATRGELTAQFAPDGAPASAVAWSPDGKLIATGCADHRVRLWSVPDRKLVAELTGHADEVHGLAFSPDGLRVASASSDSTARLWDVEKKALLATLEDHIGPVQAVAVSPDGATIATAGDDQQVFLWDAASYKRKAVMRAHRQPVTALAFSPQGLTLASGASGGGIVLWDVKEGKQRQVLNAHSQSIAAVAFLPKTGSLISASADQTIRLWRATQAKAPMP